MRRYAIPLPALVLFALALLTPDMAQGRMVSFELHSPALEKNIFGDPATRTIHAYLPPGYDDEARRFPVVYALHAFSGSALNMKIAADEAERRIRGGEIGDLIVVLPDDRSRFWGSGWRNSSTIGHYETYITRDLVDYVDSHFRTMPDPGSRALTGWSMGGQGSMHLALSHPDVFGVVSAHAGHYDWTEEHALDRFRRGVASPLASWDEYNGAGSYSAARGAFAIFAAILPNPENPPFYMSPPFELVDGEVRPVPELLDRLIDADVMHDLERYRDLPQRLRGIQVVHGRNDGDITHVQQARNLVGRLAELGMEHDYVEHDEGHEFIAEEAIPFLAAHLRYAPENTPPVTSAPPSLRPTIVGQATPFQVRVQLDGALDGSATVLLDMTRLGGNEPLRLAPTGAGVFAGGATVTPTRSGRHPLPLLLETANGERYYLASVTSEVFPVDVDILDEAIGTGWAVEATGGAGEPVFDAAVVPVRGDRSARIVLDPPAFRSWQMTLTPPAPINPFGYTALAFSIHPGDAAGASMLLATNSGSVTLVGRRAAFGLDLEDARWQDIVVPLEDLLKPGADLDAVKFSGNLKGTFHIDGLRLVAGEAPAEATAVLERRDSAVPEDFGLQANYPNPFNSGTVIGFALDRAAPVRLEVYDLLGQRVATLVSGRRDAGRYAVHWDARDDDGRALASGVYFARLRVGERVETSRMALVR